jgi:hypothetical protein
MASKFKPGAAAYAKDGRRYVVDEVEDGMVYCTSPGGGETEFPEAQLMNEAEWSTRSGGRKEMLYARLKQARAYAPYKGNLDRAASEQLLAKAERVVPGILDFTAFMVARRVMEEADAPDFVAALSIVKCREVFDAAAPETRATLLAGLIGSPPDVVVGAGRLGDNLIRAMIEKGLATSAVSYEEFSTRRRQ